MGEYVRRPSFLLTQTLSRVCHFSIRNLELGVATHHALRYVVRHGFDTGVEVRDREGRKKNDEEQVNMPHLQENVGFWY